MTNRNKKKLGMVWTQARAIILAVVGCWMLSIVGIVVGSPSGLAGASLCLLVSFLLGLTLSDLWGRDPYPDEKIKMYCLCSKEALDKMKGIRGKMITQGGHAYLHSFWIAERRFPAMARAYLLSDRAYKITLVVPTTEDLIRFKDRYEDICGVSLVTDAGLTVFDGPTVTFLGIGPIPESLIGDDLKALRTLT